MDDPQTEVRRETAKTLARIRSELAVRDRFEKALEDPDAEVRVCAARYLAEAEGIGLADFLLAAAAEPTRARYVAAQSIVADLEKQWRAKRGPMPGLDYDAASPSPDAMLQYAVTLRAWAEWAQENPAFSDSFFGRDVPTPRRP